LEKARPRRRNKGEKGAKLKHPLRCCSPFRSPGFSVLPVAKRSVRHAVLADRDRARAPWMGIDFQLAHRSRSGLVSELSERRSVAAPLHKALQRVKLRQTQGIVDLGGLAIAILGALPELAAISAAGEHRPVLLRLMSEDGQLLALQVVGAQR